LNSAETEYKNDKSHSFPTVNMKYFIKLMTRCVTEKDLNFVATDDEAIQLMVILYKLMLDPLVQPIQPAFQKMLLTIWNLFPFGYSNKSERPKFQLKAARSICNELVVDLGVHRHRSFLEVVYNTPSTIPRNEHDMWSGPCLHLRSLLAFLFLVHPQLTSEGNFEIPNIDEQLLKNTTLEGFPLPFITRITNMIPVTSDLTLLITLISLLMCVITFPNNASKQNINVQYTELRKALKKIRDKIARSTKRAINVIGVTVDHTICNLDAKLLLMQNYLLSIPCDPTTKTPIKQTCLDNYIKTPTKQEKSKK